MLEILQRYKDLQDIIAILGMDELSDEDKLTVLAGAQDRALPLAADDRGRGVHARPGVYVKLEDTVKGFREIVEGKHDELPEQAFYMVGTIEEAIEAAQGSVTVPEADEEPERRGDRGGRSRTGRRVVGRGRRAQDVRGLARDAGGHGVRGHRGDARRARRRR